MINQHLFMLLAFLFVMMIALGIAQPVLLFYVERGRIHGSQPQDRSG